MKQRKAEIYKLRMDGKTYAHIVPLYGISRERVRDIFLSTILFK